MSAIYNRINEIRSFVRDTLSESVDEYKKWKRQNVTCRGISTDRLDDFNGAGARFGDGLYTVPLGNKAMAKGYGKLFFVVNGRPKNPVIFKDTNVAEIWIQKNLYFKDYKNAREFNKSTTIQDELVKMGYDGLEIKGREIVNFRPENVLYFSNENQLIQYYEDTIESRSIEESSSILEDYPSSFSMDHFKNIKTFKERIEYCESHLKRLSSGSSRIVYKIDSEKVLKLAKNKKGIAQNETEIDQGSQTYFSNILAQIFESEENGLWVEMEMAIPINKYEFMRYTNFTIQEIGDYLVDFQRTNSGQKSFYNPSAELREKLDNDEFVQSLREFVAGTDALAGDLGQASSYGLVKRNGTQELVLIDFGITESIYNDMYAEAKNIGESRMLDESDMRLESWKSIIQSVAKKLNLQLTKFIGGGVWGIAYEIPGNRVLKITEDEREITNSKSIVGQKNRFLVDIHKVYSLKGTDKRVIIMEKLDPLTKEYEKALDIFGGYFSEFYNHEWSWGEMGFNGWEEDFDNELKVMQYNGIPIVDIYSELLGILEEAGAKGIHLSDMHEGNLGLKNGKLAAFDLS